MLLKILPLIVDGSLLNFLILIILHFCQTVGRVLLVSVDNRGVTHGSIDVNPSRSTIPSCLRELIQVHGSTENSPTLNLCVARGLTGLRYCGFLVENRLLHGSFEIVGPIGRDHLVVVFIR